MKTLLCALAFAGSLFAGTAKVVFTKSFPGSQPAFVYLSINREGALEYRELEKDDQPVTAQLSAADAAALFAMAAQLDYFKSPIESGLKVANTGKKTFRYQDENGAITEAVFNYSQNETARELLSKLEQIAATERVYLELDRAARYDKLGVNEALSQLESLWLRKELAAPQQFISLLSRIASHETYMHLARERAARLKDEITGVVSGSAEERKSK